jgi:hypothetical protein
MKTHPSFLSSFLNLKISKKVEAAEHILESGVTR